MKQSMYNSDEEETCPTCHNKMEQQSPRHYYCQTCHQNYYEIYVCPTCRHPLEQIKSCGAINYLCKTDGLVSSSKITFHYQPQQATN